MNTICQAGQTPPPWVKVEEGGKKGGCCMQGGQVIHIYRLPQGVQVYPKAATHNGETVTGNIVAGISKSPPASSASLVETLLPTSLTGKHGVHVHPH